MLQRFPNRTLTGGVSSRTNRESLLTGNLELAEHLMVSMAATTLTHECSKADGRRESNLTWQQL